MPSACSARAIDRLDCLDVLYVITSSGIGGAEVGVARWIESLGGDVTPRLVSLKHEGAVASALRRRGVDVRSFDVPSGPRGLPATLGAVDRLARVLERQRPDVIHAVLLRAGWVAHRAAARAGGPAVIVTLTSPPRARWRIAVARAMRDHVRFVAVSESVRRAWADGIGLDAAAIETIPNGVAVEPPVAAPLRQAAERDWPTSGAAQPFRLLALGRLVGEKGLGDLLCAFAQVAAQRDDASLLVVGDGPQRPALEAAIRMRGLTQRVRLRAETLDVRPHLAACDLLVHAARDEGLPTVLLEAMAAQRAVVATDAGGSAEVIRDGVNGWLVPAASPPLFAAALRDAMADPGRLARMGRAGLEIVEREFSLRATTARYRALYASLATNRTGAAA